MTEFKRMRRYMVLKETDIGSYLTTEEQDTLDELCRKIDHYRQINGRHVLQCVVVEHDWPEYEPVWAAIEARMTGRKSKIDRMIQLAVAIEADPSEPDHRRKWARECLTPNLP